MAPPSGAAGGGAVGLTMMRAEHGTPLPIFHDWLDLMLSAHLSTAAHIRSGKFDATKPETYFERENEHEAGYMEIVARYADDRPKGERAIDLFAAAHAALMTGLEEADPLGDVYMSAISFGEHGQYFTPYHVAALLAQMQMDDVKDGQTVCDPTCGSGIMLIAAARINPRARFMGIDLDERCAKMAALTRRRNKDLPEVIV